MQTMIDFDRNATTPVKESVREAMEPYLNGQYGNPSSLHQIGQETKADVERARETIAESVTADPESLVLTASGSEANTLALRGFLSPPYDGEETLIISRSEHSCVLDTAEWLEEQGVTVHYAPVNQDAQLEVDWFENHIDETVDLVSIMTVNNETGVIYPVEEIGRLCEEHDVTFHTDAVQAYGKIDVDFGQWPVDMLSISAHKVGGPKGVGALFVPRSISLDPLIFGGHQERDRRGGTENVPAVMGFSRAAGEIDPDRYDPEPRDLLEKLIRERIDDVFIIGEDTDRVTNTSGELFRGIEGEDVVMRMDMQGVALATGAACTSGSPQPSHVVSAMPLPEEYEPESFVRFSLPPETDETQISEVVDKLEKCVESLRNERIV